MTIDDLFQLRGHEEKPKLFEKHSQQSEAQDKLSPGNMAPLQRALNA